MYQCGPALQSTRWLLQHVWNLQQHLIYTSQACPIGLDLNILSWGAKVTWEVWSMITMDILDVPTLTLHYHPNICSVSSFAVNGLHRCQEEMIVRTPGFAFVCSWGAFASDNFWSKHLRSAKKAEGCSGIQRKAGTENNENKVVSLEYGRLMLLANGKCN